MKKFYFLAAMASVALASCVNEESVDYGLQESNKAIVFNSPVVSGMSRAVAGEQPTTDTNKYSTSEKFRVYAQWDADKTFENWVTQDSEAAALYMNDVEVSYSGEITNGGWTSATPYYWPKEGTLTFAAYSPSDVNAFTHAYSATGLSVTDFTLQANTADQYDFMYSSRSYNRTDNTNQLDKDGVHTGKSYNGVDILFHHALTSIKFKVKAEADYGTTKIRVKQVSILNAYSQGDFAENHNEVSKNSNPEWTDQKLPVTYAAKTEATNQELTTDVKQLAGANDIILLPQLMKHSDTEHVSIEVYYSIQNGDGPEIPQTSVISLVTGNNGDFYHENDTDVDIDQWKMGYRYTYTIIIGLNKIYFSPEVDYWKDITVTPDLKI